MKRNRKQQSLPYMSQSGFTLVELMTAVGIIAILSSLALPRFKTFRVVSARSEAKLNLKTISSLSSVALSTKELVPSAFGGSLSEGYGVSNYSGTAGCDQSLRQVIGYSASNCESLRYYYTLIYQQDSSGKPTHTVTAATWFDNDDFYDYKVGNPPTNYNSCYGSDTYRYDDLVSLDVSGEFKISSDASGVCR